jgi:hypothetical protein
MDEGLVSALCVAKIVFYLVVALSVWRISQGPRSVEGMGNIRSLTETQQSMFNNGEPPVFWNLGDVESVNKELQSATKKEAVVSGFGNSFEDQLDHSLRGN